MAKTKIRRKATKYPGVYSYVTAGGTLYCAAWRTSDRKLREKWGFKTAKKAHDHRVQQVGAAARGELVAGDSSLTLGDWLDRYLAHRRPYLSDNGYSAYEVDARLRLKPLLGIRLLAKLTEDDVRWFVGQRRERGDSPKTINNALTLLVVALGRAEYERLIARNVAATAPGQPSIKLPYERPEIDYLRLSDKEIERYVLACDPDYRPLAEVLLTGPRVSEVCGLNVGDFDPRKRELLVLRQRRGGGTGGTKAKTKHAVKISGRVVALIEAYLERERERRPCAPNDPLFVVPEFHVRARNGRTRRRRNKNAGGRWDRDRVGDMHAKALAHAGLRPLRVHDLRHTAAATWLSLGYPLTFVQRQLGHRQYQTTVDSYGHLEDTRLNDAAEAVDREIWGQAV